MQRIGQGWDIHRLVTDRPLMLGGCKIPYHKGELGHSDGDVLLHALCDALLGAVGAGDIGTFFPDTDPQWKDCESSVFVKKTLLCLGCYEIVNIDSTIILEKPKLISHIAAIKKSLAAILAVPESAISVKTKTKEGLFAKSDAVDGSVETVEAIVIVLIREKKSDRPETPA